VLGELDHASIIELRKKTRGRPEGHMLPHHVSAYSFSEYLHQCLGTYIHGGDLWADTKHTCELSKSLGIRGCPDMGVRQYQPVPSEMTLLLDNAPAHLYSTPNKISPFQKWTQDKLGIKGCLFTPAYSSWFNPVE
jgi:hypothetical protein